MKLWYKEARQVNKIRGYEHLTGNDGRQYGNDKHGPVDGGREGGVEGVVKVQVVVPRNQVRRLAQVGDHHSRVHYEAEADLHSSSLQSAPVQINPNPGSEPVNTDLILKNELPCYHQLEILSSLNSARYAYCLQSSYLMHNCCSQ